MLRVNLTGVVSKVELDYNRLSTFAASLNAKGFPRYVHYSSDM